MSIRTAVLLLSLVLALILIVFLPWSSLLTLFSGSGFSEGNVRTYARQYIESHPGWKSMEPVIQDVTIQKMNLHDEELSIAKANVRLRGDFKNWTTLYLVQSPDHSAYLVSGTENLLNEVDHDGFAQVSQRTVQLAPASKP